MQDNIFEAVTIGSVYLALENKFFTHQELLEWLISAPFNFRTSLAYKAVCQIIHPNEQYMSDDWHFLSKNPKYIYIALSFGVSKSLPTNKSGLSSISLLVAFNNTIINDTFEYNLLTVIAPEKVEFITNEVIFRAYLGRNFLHSRELTTKECNNLLVKADWTYKFRYTEDLVKDIINRMEQLSLSAPNYYEKIALPAYHAVAIKLNKRKLLTKLSQEDLLSFNKYFPNVVDPRLLNYSNIPYKIALMSNDIAGYVLGFPIHVIVPNDEQIYGALNIMEKTSVEQYINIIKDYNKILPKNLPFIDAPLEIANEKDVLMDNVVDYLPFDIVTYQTGNNVFRFIRHEFKQILESKKNPWTNEWLPETILGEIEGRQKAAKSMGLPPSRISQDVFVRIGNDKFFEDEIKPENGTRLKEMESYAFRRIIGGNNINLRNALNSFVEFGSVVVVGMSPPRDTNNNEHFDESP